MGLENVGTGDVPGANSSEISSWRAALTRYLLHSRMRFESSQNGEARMPNVMDRKTADACQSQTQLWYKPRRTPGLSLEGASQVRRNVHNISIRVELNRCPIPPPENILRRSGYR